MSDLIKRKDAIDEIRKSIIPHDIACTYYSDLCINAVRRVPSADRPRGEWIIEIDANGNTYGKCSICGMKQYAGQLNFCPDCGAKMKGRVSK